LAHGRYADPVSECDVLDLQFVEQMRHSILLDNGSSAKVVLK
jgi:hypothetical protein